MSSLTTATPGGPVKLRPATLSDLTSIARCWHAAFFDDVVIGQIMHPNRKEYPEDVYYFLLRGIRERYFDWKHQFIVVTDSDGKTIGAADWSRIGEGGRLPKLAVVDPRNLLAPAMSLFNSISLKFWPNRAADPKKESYLDSAVEKSQHHWTGDQAKCWDLHVCGVHPDWQGKGIGKMLCQWGTDRADEEGVWCSVITGESKRAFYGKSGFGGDGGGMGGEGIILFREPVKT